MRTYQKKKISLFKKSIENIKVNIYTNTFQKLAIIDADQQCGQSFNLGLKDCDTNLKYTLYGIYAAAIIAEIGAFVYSGGGGTDLVVDGTMIAVGLA